MLGVPPRWVAAGAREGRIPCVRLGRYVRFDRGDVLAWLERCKHPGRATTLRRPPSGGV
ncbi:MAG: helix-turn-helix domain-containing protein [Actinobacteria bacterium]|nr:helix-turn-helix domain-containing protein [Actinomycetota bacterium]